MIEQKPVAQCYINVYGECEQIDWLGTINAKVDEEFTALFTAEQLKAERDNAIKECAQKAVDITNDADVGNAVLKLLSTD